MITGIYGLQGSDYMTRRIRIDHSYHRGLLTAAEAGRLNKREDRIASFIYLDFETLNLGRRWFNNRRRETSL